ncbi:GtrA family protein [Bacteroides sp. 224]|uniref:GtrA family protein n=1 Tax=Bacteroides sp. 224 TaxID=2302936 RepID=UPI0013CF8071|nr:GtrA family protein [Bacteroides sp. 224]NDV64589.1 GtrA family protein [Bacteroides sp. 224]
MANWIKETIRKLSEKGGIFMFIRAQFSSQLASVCDFVATILLAKLFGLYYVYATLLGAICGGVVNCVINYQWTFKSKECRKTHVALKYLIVWIGSILLNTLGTYCLTETLVRIPWLRDLIDQYFDDFFIIPKIIVSLLVSFLWNYNMHRLFVYRNRNIRDFFRRKES